MRRVFICLWVSLLVAAGPVLGQPAVQRQISVIGEGRVDAAPDMATITIGVTNEAKSARVAMAETSAAVSRVLTRLDSLGLASRDLQTRNVTLSPVWSGDRASLGGPNRITGFVAANTVFVRVRDLASLGNVLDAVIDDGANTFDGLEFSLQEPGPMIDEARRRAVADGMARAALLAEAAGVTLGEVVTISDHGGGGPVMMEMAAARGGGVPVAAGEVTLNATVSMVFAIGGN